MAQWGLGSRVEERVSASAGCSAHGTRHAAAAGGVLGILGASREEREGGQHSVSDSALRTRESGPMRQVDTARRGLDRRYGQVGVPIIKGPSGACIALASGSSCSIVPTRTRLCYLLPWTVTR